MITTQQEWKDYIVDSSVLGVQCNVTLANGASLTLTTDRIMEGTLQIHDEICDVGQIDIGGTVAQEISFSISNHDGLMSGYDFRGARCVLYLIANGVSIQKGVYTLYTNNTVGRVIPVYGYDHMADEQYNTPITSTISFNGMTAVNAIKSLGYTLESEDFPNASYVLPNVTTDDMDEGVTKRDILGYICQLCGCYARYNHLGKLAIKYFSVLDYSNDLDGGLFHGAFGRNMLRYPYQNTRLVSNGITWEVSAGGRVSAYGLATADSYFSLLTAPIDFAGTGETKFRISLFSTGASARSWWFDGVVEDGNGNTETLGNLLVSGSGNIYDLSGYKKLTSFFLYVKQGWRPDTLIYPIIQYASNTDTSYEKYKGEGWTDGDDADGGSFKGSYGRNKLAYPYVESGKTENGITWRLITDTGSQVLAYGTSTATTRFRLQYNFHMPIGEYRITGCTGGSLETYYLAMFKRDGTDGIRVAYCTDNEMSNHTFFTVESELDEYVLMYIILPDVNMGDSLEEGTILKPMILSAEDNDNSWDIYQTAWTGGDSEDGGLFGFWERAIPASKESDAYPLSKIMTEPVASLLRKIITGVKVTDINQEEVIVGTEDYLIEIDSNPFIINQTVASAVATQAYTVVSGVNFFPFTVTWSADPSFEAGDLISFTSLGRKFVTPCTSFDYQLGNMSTITCNDNDLNNQINY